MPKVSVIIPTHSRPHLLPRAVESARQAGRDVEIIVVDDASTDATAEVCRKLDGIRYIRLERNQGVAGARNIGILASTADYVAFLDDDDVRLPGSIDMQFDALQANPDAGLVYSPVQLADQDGRLLGKLQPQRCPSGDVFWELFEWNFIYPSAMVMRKECFYRVGLLDSHAPGIDEWDLWVRIAELFPVVAVEEPVTIYTLPTPVSNQLTTSLSSALCASSARQQLILLRLPRALAAPPSQRLKVRRRLLSSMSDKLIFQAADALQAGVKQKARVSILAALRLNPMRAMRPWTFKLLLRSLTLTL